MMECLVSEYLFYGGLAVMAISVVIAVGCIILFSVTGRRIRKRLEKEYGKPEK